MAAGKVAQSRKAVKNGWKIARDLTAVGFYIVALGVMIPGHMAHEGIKRAARRLRSHRVRRGVLVDLTTGRLSFNTATLLTDAQWSGPSWLEASAMLGQILNRLVLERFPLGRYSETITNSVLLDALVLDALDELPRELALLERSALLRRNLA